MPWNIYQGKLVCYLFTVFLCFKLIDLFLIITLDIVVGAFLLKHNIFYLVCQSNRWKP